MGGRTATRRWMLVAAVAAIGSAAWLHGAARGEAEATGTAAPRADEASALIAAVAPEVEAIRGLHFRKPVAAKVVGIPEAREHARRRLRMFESEDDLAAQQRAYELLGLIPGGTDVLAEYLDVLDEQAGGYYDPRSRSFLLVSAMPKGLLSLLASHELTHALEDQQYDLDRRLKDASGDDDLLFARSAVHEGSATIVMSIYAARAAREGKLRAEDLEALAQSEAGKGAKLSAMPAVMRRELLGAYFLGASFLLRGQPLPVATNVFPSVDVERCYRDGPTSSEQILHPEKYWDPAKKDEPRQVVVRGAGKVLGPTWKRSGSGVLGELTLGVLVGAPTPETAFGEVPPAADKWTDAAAAGWGGDRWELWSSGTRFVALLSTVWDSVGDAEEFAAALPPGGVLRWKRERDRVAIVAGDAGEALDPLLDAMLDRKPAR